MAECKDICDYCLEEIEEEDYVSSVLFNGTVNGKTTPKFHQECYKKWINGEKIESKTDEEETNRFELLDI